MRSLTLDVKVWEPSVIGFFQSIGNEYANSLWEELLPRWGNDHREKSTSPSRIVSRYCLCLSSSVCKHTLAVGAILDTSLESSVVVSGTCCAGSQPRIERGQPWMF